MGHLLAIYDKATKHLTVTCLLCGSTLGPEYYEWDEEDEQSTYEADVKHAKDCPLGRLKLGN